MVWSHEEAVDAFNASLKVRKHVLPVFVKEKSSEEVVGLYEIFAEEIVESSFSVFVNVNFDNTSGFGYYNAFWPDEPLREFRTQIKYLRFPLSGLRDSLNTEYIKNIGSRCFKDKYLIVHDCQLAFSSAQVKDYDVFSASANTLFVGEGEIGCHTLQLNLEDYEYVFDSDKFIPIGNKQIKK